jgi:Ran GTPase-activating protein (RanGAP) involved in mRNA processing and transport
MALSQNANLSVLKLGYNNLGDEGVTTLAAGIAVHRSLVSLDLGFNNFGDEGCKSLAVAMQQACQTNNHTGTIRTLYLAGNSIGEDGAIALADCIRQGSCLKKLYLTGNRLGADGIKAITEAIVEDELRRSESTTTCMDENFVDVENPANDDSYDNDNNNNDKPPSADNSSFRGMQELFFGGTGMGSAGALSVARLLEKSSCLRVISLPNCNIGDEELSMLASGIRPNRDKLPLESIQLSFNNITYKGLEALINAVWGSSTLRELRLDNNDIGDRGAHQVAAILPVVKTLEVLDVGFNSIKAAGLNTLMKAVAETQHLKSLSVSGNAIDVAAAKAVAYALAYNHSLQSLYLVHCTIGHEGQRHISAGVVSNSNTSIRKLTGFDLGRKLLAGRTSFTVLSFFVSFVIPHLSYIFFHLV